MPRIRETIEWKVEDAAPEMLGAILEGFKSLAIPPENPITFNVPFDTFHGSIPFFVGDDRSYQNSQLNPAPDAVRIAAKLREIAPAESSVRVWVERTETKTIWF